MEGWVGTGVPVGESRSTGDEVGRQRRVLRPQAAEQAELAERSLVRPVDTLDRLIEPEPVRLRGVWQETLLGDVQRVRVRADILPV